MSVTYQHDFQCRPIRCEVYAFDMKRLMAALTVNYDIARMLTRIHC